MRYGIRCITSVLYWMSRTLVALGTSSAESDICHELKSLQNEDSTSSKFSSPKCEYVSDSVSVTGVSLLTTWPSVASIIALRTFTGRPRRSVC